MFTLTFDGHLFDLSQDGDHKGGWSSDCVGSLAKHLKDLIVAGGCIDAKFPGMRMPFEAFQGLHSWILTDDAGTCFRRDTAQDIVEMLIYKLSQIDVCMD